MEQLLALDIAIHGGLFIAIVIVAWIFFGGDD